MAPKKTPQSPSSSSTDHGSRQDDDAKNESILRAFDMDMKYGPSDQLTRMQRYEKAVREGLNPPEKIGELLRSGSYWTGVARRAVK